MSRGRRALFEVARPVLMAKTHNTYTPNNTDRSIRRTAAQYPGSRLFFWAGRAERLFFLVVYIILPILWRVDVLSEHMTFFCIMSDSGGSEGKEGEGGDSILLRKQACGW